MDSTQALLERRLAALNWRDPVPDDIQSQVRMAFNEALAGGANMNGDGGPTLTPNHALDCLSATSRIEHLTRQLAMKDEALRAMRLAMHEIDIVASNTIPPDGKDAGFAALREIIKLLNPFRARAALKNTDEQEEGPPRARYFAFANSGFRCVGLGTTLHGARSNVVWQYEEDDDEDAVIDKIAALLNTAMGRARLTALALEQDTDEQEKG